LPAAARQQVAPEMALDEFKAKDLRTVLTLKTDHASRPLWVVSLEGLALSYLIPPSPCLVNICVQCVLQQGSSRVGVRYDIGCISFS